MKNENKVNNILMITAFPTYGAGSGVQVTALANSYKNEGKKVTIITGNNKTDFEKIPGVKYHVVPFTAEEENPEKIPGQCKFNYLMFTTHTESTANFWDASLEQIKEYEKAFRKAINEEVKEEKPDVIHAQHNWISTSIATETNIPVITTIHGTDLMGFERSKKELKRVKEEMKAEKDPAKLQKLKQEEEKYNLYIEHSNRAAINAKKIIVISEDQKNRFETLFPLAAKKVELVENGYDTKKFYVDNILTKEEVLGDLTSQNKDNQKIDLDYDKLVVFVGKFADFKGIDVLLDSAKIYEQKMKEEGKKVETIIVGSGQLEGTLKKQAKDLELENVDFVGRKNTEEVNKIQNLADVSLIPSRNEPFGLVVVEGMACGHPVIATNSGGIPGILNSDNQDISDKSKTYVTPLGVLVPMDDSKALGEAVCDVLDEKVKFNNKYIADYAKEHYAQEKVTKNILNIFEEAKEIDTNKEMDER